jgi:UDP-N-acetyl-D-mannosaminuronic acid transferase (WecB/TagA/CpsF family)
VHVEIRKPTTAPFIVGTIYRPPSASVDPFATIKQLVKKIDDENKEFYILGDFNANMLDTSNNATNNLNSFM